MMFGHEHHHEVSTIHAPQGPTPLWCKLAFAMAVLAVVGIAGHQCLWRLF
jgi:hypothetical protein